MTASPADRLKALVGKAVCNYKNTLYFYLAAKRDDTPPLGDGRVFHDVGDLAAYDALCKQFSLTVPHADAADRFAHGDRFCLLTNADDWGCFGWYTRTPCAFPVTEINVTADIPAEVSVLYHFFTNTNLRRQGYYTDLLRQMLKAIPCAYAFIYANDDNAASNGAIRKVGFTFVGAYKHRTMPPVEQLLRRVQQETA